MVGMDMDCCIRSSQYALKGLHSFHYSQESAFPDSVVLLRCIELSGVESKRLAVLDHRCIKLLITHVCVQVEWFCEVREGSIKA